MHKFPDREQVVSEIKDGSGECGYPKEKIVWNIDPDKEWTNCKFWRPLSECFKVMGLISPEATWVKEGDEFEEDQIKICVDPDNQDNWYVDVPSGKYHDDDPIPPSRDNLYTDGTKIVYIKGPCGHFH